MDLTLSKVVEAARQRRAAVTAEVGGHIVLLLLQLQASGPRRVTPELVGLTASGDVELAPSPAAERREVEVALRALLASLLSLSQSAPPALRATSERAAVGDLAAFEAELTAALIPINHAAARRALARVFRETQRAQRSVGGAEQERESAPVSAALRATESSSPLPAALSVAVAKTPVPASLVSAPEPPASRDAPAVAELEIDVDVDVAAPEAEPIAAAAVQSEPEPAEVELEIIAEVDVEDLDRLLASEPPPASFPALAVAPIEVVDAEASEPGPASLVHSLTPAARALTPLPASAVRKAGSAADPARDSLEIPTPDSWVTQGAGEDEPPQRSDLGALLDGYLSYTRREEDMTAGLRRMIGLEPWRASGLGSERTGLGQ
jgi:hypothetical protein